jgi:hypothetical protein
MTTFPLRGKLYTKMVPLLLFLAVFPARPTLAADPVPYRSVAPLVESTTERTAAMVLRRIAEARSDLHRKDVARARGDLTDAAKLMATIREDLSTAPARNLIGMARRHLEYEAFGKVRHELPPIRAALDAISDYLPTDRANEHVNRAGKCLERRDRKCADRELSLADGSLVIVEVELPLARAERYVDRARGFLAAGKPEKADKALAIAEQRAMPLLTQLRSPLFLARQNAWLALRNYHAEHRGQAGPFLEQARTYLEQAASAGDTKGREEAGKLSREIHGLEKQQGEHKPIAEKLLKAAWEKSVALAERATAYIAAGLSEERAEMKGEGSLIEARLHVAYAETYQVTTGEADKAAKELERASAYLQKAEKSRLADRADLQKLRTIGTMLKDLAAHTDKHDAAIRERYETVKEELRGIRTQEELSGLSQKIREDR